MPHLLYFFIKKTEHMFLFMFVCGIINIHNKGEIHTKGVMLMSDDLIRQINEFIIINNIDISEEQFIHFLTSFLQHQGLSHESFCLQSDHHED